MDEQTLKTRYAPAVTAVQKESDNTLKGYLKTLSTLECQVWNQDRLISRLKQQEASLGKPRKISKPEQDDSVWTGIAAIVAFAVGIIFLFWNPFHFISNDSFLDLILTGLLHIAFSLLVIPFCIGMLFFWLTRSYKSPSYKMDLHLYETACEFDEQRVKHELLMKQDLQQQIASVKSEQERTKQALNQMYSLSIIHASYHHNLVAVSSFYDYFDKGICTRLEGRDGAYAFYEEDLRFQRIESKLDVIITKLDEIAANQVHLASLIREGNETLRRIENQNKVMSNQLDTISENTAVTSYNTYCCAKSMSAMESMAMYQFIRS